MSIDIEAERKRFEEWARQNEYSMDKRTDTKSVMYESLATRCAWDGWAASRGNRRAAFWRYVRHDGRPYKWNEGEPTEDDRRNLIVSEKIQIAYCEE